jgi:hypothetical protein
MALLRFGCSIVSWTWFDWLDGRLAGRLADSRACACFALRDVYERILLVY